MTVYLVGAGPGDPGLLTRRGAELLAQADVVVHDRLIDPSLLALVKPDALVVDVGKRPAASSERAFSGERRQTEINALLIEHGRAGRTVVRLKGGDPFVFGRGGEEAEALHRAGIPWAIVPGVSSAFAVPAVAGIPVTHRGVSTSVTVVTGHVGDPTADGGVDWDAIGRAGGTLVILMGMATRAEIAERLQAAGRSPSTPVAVIEWGTTRSQRIERTTLDRLGGVALGSPAVIVVGPVSDLPFRPTLPEAAGPLSGWTVVVTRAPHQAGSLSAALKEAGATVVELPVIDIAPPDDGGVALADAASRAREYDWLAFTSTNAVRAFMGVLTDVRLLAGVKLAAVGAATEAELASRGLRADLVAGRGRVGDSTAAGLAEAFPAAPVGGRVLFPRSSLAREDLSVALRAKGWVVDEVEAYRTVDAAPPAGPVLDVVLRADAVTFTSPSTVQAFVRMTQGCTPLVRPMVVCIGPVTARAARQAGLEVDVESSDPSAAAMVRGLIERRAKRSGR